MHKWTKRHAALVGRIIFANFLGLSLEKYRKVIDEVEGTRLFKKLSRCGPNSRKNIRAISTEYLSKTNVSRKKTEQSSKTVAEILKTGGIFSISYACAGFNKVYKIGDNLRQSGSDKHIDVQMLHKLRRISSRNELTYRILEGVIEHQESFLGTCAPMDLVPLSRIQLAKWLNRGGSGKVNHSWISRLVNGLSVIIPSGEERTLGSFFPTQKGINKGFIKQLLDKENEEMESGRLGKPLTDNEIKVRLKKKYGLSLSRWTVSQCRRDMGVPPSNRRLSGCRYPRLYANFSILYPLTKESVQSNVPTVPGVYEFRLKNRGIEYPNGKSQVIYVGSTRNIRKRLKEHLGKKGKNGLMDCSFRYMQLAKNWKREENSLYNLFAATYGAPPRYNRVRPGQSGKI